MAVLILIAVPVACWSADPATRGDTTDYSAARRHRYIIKARKRETAPEPPLADIGPRVVKIERVVPWRLWCERVGGLDC